MRALELTKKNDIHVNDTSDINDINDINDTNDTHDKETRYLIDKYLDFFVKNTGLPKETAQELFDDYMTYLFEVIESLEKSLATNDFTQSASLAHQLKGSSGSLKVTVIFELAKELEKACLSEETAICRRIFEEIKGLAC